MKRISKTLLEHISALDDHLYLLRKNLQWLQKDQAHLKSIAAELRVLVCFSSKTEGLLWRIIERLDVSDAVELELAGNVNVNAPSMSSVSFAFLRFRRAGSEPSEIPPKWYSLRKVIKYCEAVFVEGKGITHENLIKAIAQQMGSAHEDNGIDLSLAALKAIFINGTQPYISTLTLVSELVLEVGERVLSTAEDSLGFIRKTHD